MKVCWESNTSSTTSSTFSDLLAVYVQWCMTTWKCEKSTLQMHFYFRLGCFVSALHCRTGNCDCDTYLHGLVELVRWGQNVNVAAWHPECGYVLCDPSEVSVEAACALSSGWTCGLGHRSGGWVRFSQQGSQQQHGGAGGNMETAAQDFRLINKY